MLTNVLMFTAQKGGVGKTMLSANVAGAVAAAGCKVLVVDLDEQGNLSLDLGYARRSDSGKNLMATLRGDEVLQPVEGVRPNIDAVPGGSALSGLGVHLAVMGAQMEPWHMVIEDALRPVADQYDLIVIDSPPASGQLHLAAYTAALGLVIPVAPDLGSLYGVRGVYQRYLQVKQLHNPDLSVLGVVLNRFHAGSTLRRDAATEVLERMFEGRVRLFEPVLRDAPAAVNDTREYGLLVAEYEDAKRKAPKWWELRRAAAEESQWDTTTVDLRDHPADGPAKPSKKGKKKKGKKKSAAGPVRFASNTEQFSAELTELTDNIMEAFSAAQLAAVERHQASTGLVVGGSDR